MDPDFDFAFINFNDLQPFHHHDLALNSAPETMVFPIITPQDLDIAEINEIGDFLINPIAAPFEIEAADNFPLKMSAVGVYKPKQRPLGEDACFIWPEFQTLGVADGVGGWRKHGIDSGEYARRLMVNSVLALRDETPGDINPIRVLERAFYATRAEGSSTACIVTLNGDKLTAANVGDSGFLLIRNDAVVYRSPKQQRKFNSPLQLGRRRDNPSVADLIEVAVMSGDVVVAGTDGLLDNVHEHEIVEIAGNSKIGDDDDLCQQAYYMAETAHFNSIDRIKDSPFSIEARMAGIFFRGGKPDDITVIIARIHD